MTTAVASQSNGELALVRRAMVDCQLRTFGVTDLRILAAVETVPREFFVPASAKAKAYSDSPVTLSAGGERRVMLAPMIEARMFQLAGLDGESKVLVIGAGAGYAAALAAQIASKVVLLETSAFAVLAREALAKAGAQAEVIEGDMAAGAADHGPFDLILIPASCEIVPDALRGQLAEGGRLVTIRKSADDPSGMAGNAMKIERTGTIFSENALFSASAPVLPGFERKPVFSF